MTGNFVSKETAKHKQLNGNAPRLLMIFSKQTVSTLWLSKMDVEISRNCTSSFTYLSNGLKSFLCEMGSFFSQERHIKWSREFRCSFKKEVVSLCYEEVFQWISYWQDYNCKHDRTCIQIVGDLFKANCDNVLYFPV